jgi:hypothetical protein
MVSFVYRFVIISTLNSNTRRKVTIKKCIYTSYLKIFFIILNISKLKFQKSYTSRTLVYFFFLIFLLRIIFFVSLHVRFFDSRFLRKFLWE